MVMKRYVIESQSLTVEIDAFGAEIQTIVNKQNAFNYMWNGDANYWKRVSPVLFPIVGRLKNNSLNVGDRSYNMPQHGFARDRPFKMVNKNTHEITFELESDAESLQCFPYPFSLQISYHLVDNQLECKFKVKNNHTKELHFSIGAHPGFMLKGQLHDYTLEFSQDNNLNAYDLHNGLLKNEYILSLQQNKLFLENSTFNNDALVLENVNSSTVILQHKTRSHKIEMHLNKAPYLGVWAPKGCNTMLCIEPWWGVADTIDGHSQFSEKKGIQTLQQDHQFEASYRLVFD